jgi:fructose transport system substrate-binding protein
MCYKHLRRVILGSTFAVLLGLSTSALAGDLVGLITKTDANPFFVKMREGAKAKADELGLTLQMFAGKYNGDYESQITAIEDLIVAKAKGFAIVPNDSKAVVPAIRKAREAGLLVIVLDSPTDPIDAADATFATDNFSAGELIGEWAAKTLGPKAAQAHIAFIDLSVSQTAIDVLRDQGFMKGFGIDIKDPKRIGDENDPRIVGHQVGSGAEDKSQVAMENLLRKDQSINVVYTFDEVTAAGALQALASAGKNDGSVLVVSIDGGCAGVRNVATGAISATSQQYPLKMASMAMEAINDFVKTGAKPKTTAGLNFTDTGVALVTDKPVPDVPSITSKEGLQLCWGE